MARASFTIIATLGSPVFLVQIYAKNEKANVSGAEKIALAKMAGEIKRKYGR